ncbi:MAG: hypothetical protein V3S54_06680 [Woeseiaceae bacterium]
MSESIIGLIDTRIIIATAITDTIVIGSGISPAMRAPARHLTLTVEARSASE